ncbi:fatty acid--CoA ligase family protein [Amycolatopsis sp.]|uniref:class I adenylate-forming enzyme family protein n=1 Tax=Amycolatopsis sp. TaxID=37632 RepID=UPI002CD44371|nr:fatty acid--CoA ligase family protein [Amycolatopsis sp.]HVV10514.1 fatty acid--CoA ligase family protein [Amycolatopsis sp.]
MTSLTSRLNGLWEIDPAAQAISYDGSWWTWGQLTATADACKEIWQNAGAGPDARIAIVLENRPEFAAAVVAVFASGRCLTTVSPLQPTARMAADLERVRPRILVASPAVWERLNEAGIQVGLRVTLMPDGKVLAEGEPPAPKPELDDAAGTAVEMLTSGTTGPAKRVRLSYRQVESALNSARSYDRRPESERKALPQGVGIVANPMVHIGGLWGVLQSMRDHRRIVLLERFRVQPWVDVIRTYRPKLGSLTPAGIKMVLDADVPAEDLSSLRAINSGTAPLAPELAERFQDRYGIPVLSVYGATEFCGAIAGWSLDQFREYGRSKRGSVGRAQPGVRLRVVDNEGNELPAGTSGLLQVCTPQAEAGADAWTATSDLARIDEDGFLWIEGRADDTIIRGGFKVSPATVATVLEKHPAVREASVAGRDDARLGQVPVAAVELATGHAAPAEEELIRLCRRELLPYEVPVRILVVDALPRTPSMKVSRVDLLELFDRFDSERDEAAV